MKHNPKPLLVPVILSGGSGSRLWPLSREGHPKPFIELSDGETLLEKTYRRVNLLENISRENGKPLVITITNREYYFISKDELENNLDRRIFLDFDYSVESWATQGVFMYNKPFKQTDYVVLNEDLVNNRKEKATL